MAHGIARLSPDFCRDKMRFWTLGQSEGSWFQHNVLDMPDPRYPIENDGTADSCRDIDNAPGTEPSNERLVAWGLPADVCRDVLNPGERPCPF